MGKAVRVLLVEDSEHDALLLERTLEHGGYAPTCQRVDSATALRQALDREWDVVVADYTMPGFGGLEALQIVRARREHLPFLFVSGTIGEERAVEAMRAGADDYFIKGDLGRLLPAIARELRDAEARRERARMEAERLAAEEALLLSEERHRLLFEHIADAILVFDRRGEVIFASASVREVLGVDPEQLRERSSLDLLHPEDEAAARESFDKVAGDAEARATVEVRMKHGDGSWRTMDCVLRNLLHRKGIGGVVVTCRDVTQRKKLEAEFRQVQKLESVGRLAGGVAHDFNNLLTAVLGHTGFLLMDEGLTESQRRDLEEIERAADRATRLTRQLLAFSRRQVFDLRAVEMNRVVEGLSSMFARLLGEAVRVETDLAPDLGTVRADVGQMEQVLMNLAVNARDAMPRGGRLVIRTKNIELEEKARWEGEPAVRPGRYVRLSVSDTGTGMDPDTAAHVFEPFFTTKPEGEGTGLGLATVYGIVKQSGGYVWLDTAPGRGTRFDIDLPRVERPAVSTVEPTVDLGPVRGGSETVLLVEDEEGVRNLASRVLRGLGYEVVEAANGRGGASILRGDRRLDLLLTDVVLPDLGGGELAELARSRTPSVPVLFMSGYALSALRGGVPPDFGASLLEKPFTATDLARRVRETLDRQQRDDTVQ